VFNFLSNLLGSSGTKITKFVSSIGASGAGAAHFVVTNILIIGSVSGILALGTAGTIAGTYRNASDLHSGTMPDARLSSNVAKYDDLAPTFAHGLTAASFTGNLVGNASTATALASNPTGCNLGSFASSIDSGANLACSNDGSGLTNLNASNLSSGTVADALIGSNIVRSDQLSGIFKNTTVANFTGPLAGDVTGTQSATVVSHVSGSTVSGDISGNAGGFTGTLSGDVTGTQNVTVVSNVSDGALSPNVVLLDGSHGLDFTGAGTITADAFAGDGSALSGISSTQLTDTGNIAYLDGTNTLDFTGAGTITADAFSGPLTGNVTGNVSGSAASFTGNLVGDVTGTQGATVVSHVSDGALSANVAKYDDLAPSFTHGLTAASFSGVGSGLTSLTGANVTGTVANATTAVNFTGALSGDVTGTQGATVVSHVNASNIDSGTLNDSRLSTNIPLKNALSNIFTGSITAASFSGNLTGNVSGNAGTATALQTPRNINGVSFDGTADITVTAAAGTLTGTTLNSSVVASSLTSVGTLVNLTVTNPIVGSVTGSSGSTTGNAATATALQNPRTINGVSFDGTTNITVTADAGTLTGTILNATVTDSSLTSVGTLANLTVTNPISGSVTGSSGSTTGNAATATKLQTARNINGVAFDGTSDITVTADSSTLTGTVLNATVVASSLTSVGTLTNLTVTNPINGSVTGNAGTATKLQTARNINGVAFDGTGDITVTANAGTLTGTTLNSTVVNSSLTSVGTLSNLTSNGSVNFSGATSLTVPITSAAINNGDACTTGTLIYTSNSNQFFFCVAGSYVHF